MQNTSPNSSSGPIVLGVKLSRFPAIAKQQKAAFIAAAAAAVTVIIPLGIGVKVGGWLAAFLIIIPAVFALGLCSQRSKNACASKFFCCCTGLWIVLVVISILVVVVFTKKVTDCICDTECLELPNMPQGPRGPALNLTELREEKRYIELCPHIGSYDSMYSAFAAFEVIVALLLLVSCIFATQIACCQQVKAFDTDPSGGENLEMPHIVQQQNFHAPTGYASVPVATPVGYATTTTYVTPMPTGTAPAGNISGPPVAGQAYYAGRMMPAASAPQGISGPAPGAGYPYGKAL
jgi:hypothetical protein